MIKSKLSLLIAAVALLGLTVLSPTSQAKDCGDCAKDKCCEVSKEACCDKSKTKCCDTKTASCDPKSGCCDDGCCDDGGCDDGGCCDDGKCCGDGKASKGIIAFLLGFLK
jgi:hypothetical protein